VLAVEAKNIRLSAGKKAEQGNRIENPCIPKHNRKLKKKHCQQNKGVITNGVFEPNSIHAAEEQECPDALRRGSPEDTKEVQEEQALVGGNEKPGGCFVGETQQI
jgi:hypothetical protein